MSQAVERFLTRGGVDMLVGVAASGREYIGSAIDECWLSSALRVMKRHLKYMTDTCRFCPERSEFHLVSPACVEAAIFTRYRGTQAMEMGSVDALLSKAKDTESMITVKEMSKMDSVDDVLAHLKNGTIVVNNNRRGERDGTMMAFCSIINASHQIKDGTIDLLAFENNPYRRESTRKVNSHTGFMHCFGDEICNIRRKHAPNHNDRLSK